jgi:hypothetical protein
MFPDLDDYIRIKRDEQVLYQMWVDGNAVSEMHAGRKCFGEFLFGTSQPERPGSGSVIVVVLAISGGKVQP